MQTPSTQIPAPSSLQLDIDHSPWVGNKNKEADAVSAEHMENLSLLTSKSEGRHASEEEMVDLTEPRFESFCMTNVNFP